MSSESSVHVTIGDDQIAVVTLDQPGTSANILSDLMFDQIESAVEPLIRRDDLKGLVLISAKPKIFVAGADLVAINKSLDRPDHEIIAWCDRGRAVMSLFRSAPFMTVAAIHGACVGGGFELTLWCDQRIASDDRRTVIGLPESKLGLVPGWGGTFHVARIGALKTGQDAALRLQIEMVTGGELIGAARALEDGLVDQVINDSDHDKLLNAAVERITTATDGEFRSRREAIEAGFPVADTLELMANYGSEIVNNRKIFPFAPTVALEHMIRATSLPITEAGDSESVAMSQVYGSPASYGLINNFFLGDHNRKSPGRVDVKLANLEIKRLGIVGAGMMGDLIAGSATARGIDVVLLDQDSASAETVSKKHADAKGSVSVADGYEGFSGCQLVLETATEKQDVKDTILKEIESAVPVETVIASNTSAIPVSKLAASLKNPGRFCGIHFCHPELMSLAEVIRGEKTSEETAANAVTFVRSLRKIPVAMNDGAGFVVNRLLSAMLDQSLRLLERGHLMISIDGAMRRFGFEAGPFEMVDVIGADTCLAAGQSMWDAGLKCVSSSLILPRLVKLGRTGRKTGKGFYRYADARALPALDPDVGPILEPYIDDRTEPAFSAEAITQQIANGILAATALEASRILDDEIVADDRDIDLCIINGFGFPAEHGGILMWADRFGIENVISILEQLSGEEPRMAPTARLKEMAKSGTTFYTA